MPLSGEQAETRAGDLAEERLLVENMIAGDAAALDDFAADYFPGLYRFALRRLGNEDLARDIVQTTVCKAIASLRSYRGEAPLFTWLCACCRNEIASHFRKRQRAPREVSLPEEEDPAPALASPGEEGPERTVLRWETSQRVHEALDELPPRYGQALEWKYIEGLSVKEIAWRLRLSPKAAESLLTRARLAFRNRYEGLARGLKRAAGV